MSDQTQNQPKAAATPAASRQPGLWFIVAICTALTLSAQIALADLRYAVVWIAGAVIASVVLTRRLRQQIGASADRNDELRRTSMISVALYISVAVMLLASTPIFRVDGLTEAGHLVGAVSAQALLGGLGLSMFCWVVGLVTLVIGKALSLARPGSTLSDRVSIPAVFTCLVLLICAAILVGVLIQQPERLVVAAPIVLVVATLLFLGRSSVERRLDVPKLVLLLPITLFGAVALYSPLAAGIAKLSPAEAHFFLDVMDRHVSWFEIGTYMDEVALLGAVWVVLSLAIHARRFLSARDSEPTRTAAL